MGSQRVRHNWDTKHSTAQHSAAQPNWIQYRDYDNVKKKKKVVKTQYEMNKIARHQITGFQNADNYGKMWTPRHRQEAL